MPKTLFVSSVIDDDPDVAEVKFEVTLKPGVEPSGLDSLVVERALLKFASQHVINWAKYTRDNGMKTL